MSEQVLGIIRPYVANADPKVRANAASALAHIGTEASARALAKMGLDETDPEILEGIASAASRMPPVGRATLAAAVHARISGDQEERGDIAGQRRAYLLLGLLRARGVTEAKTRASLAERARRCVRMIDEVRRHNRRSFGARAGGVMVAAGLAALGWTVFLVTSFKFLQPGEMWALGALAFLPSTGVGLLVSQAAGPIVGQPTRGVALVREVVLGALVAIPAGGTLGLILDALFEKGAPVAHLLSGALIFLPAIVIARLAVTLFWGSDTVGLRTKLAALGATSLAATATTFVAIYLMNEAVITADSLSIVWYFAMPVAAVVPWVSMTVENRFTSPDGVTGPGGLVLATLASFGLVVAPLVSFASQGFHAPPDATTLIGSAWDGDTVSLGRVPATVELRVAQPLGVFAKLPGGFPGPDYVLLLEEGPGHPELQGDDPPHVVTELGSGVHRMKACLYGQRCGAGDLIGPTDILGIVGAVVWWKGAAAAEGEELLTLSLERSVLPGDRAACSDPTPNPGSIYATWADSTLSVSRVGYDDGMVSVLETDLTWPVSACVSKARYE